MIRAPAAGILALFYGSAFAPIHAHQYLPPGIATRIPPRVVTAEIIARPPVSLVERGRILFERETFGGNGRTCATCHARDENFTLSPADVARRPKGDPLFVHERRRELAELENATALRERALILENVDGFDKPGVLRGSMHIFALGLSTKPQAGLPVTHTLGWSGDGSPGTGSLREFAVGAVVQHMPRTLRRIEGSDFRLPTGEELDALEAFQLSIGRHEDLQTDPALPNALVFRDANVTAGQTLFHGMPSRKGTRRCGGCHTSGGALNDVGENEQRATGVSFRNRSPACLYREAPGDGGFGAEPLFSLNRSQFCAPGTLPGAVYFRGDQFFSTQSAIEAADTLPAFHNNSADTLEEVVDHYRSDEFNDSITGAGNGFLISDTQRNQIASFLRALNVLENIRSANASLEAAVSSDLPSRMLDNISDANNSIGDAIEVLLQNAPIRIHRTDALPSLRAAQFGLRVGSKITFARSKLAQASNSILISTDP